jgi:hypothetical protein
MSYAIKESIKGELLTAIKNGETLQEIEGNSHEWIDGYLPVYYNAIVREWQDMPSEYNDRGRAELGAGDDFTIYSLMSLDLYIYYTDLFNEVITELEGEVGE